MPRDIENAIRRRICCRSLNCRADKSFYHRSTPIIWRGKMIRKFMPLNILDGCNSFKLSGHCLLNCFVVIHLPWGFDTAFMPAFQGELINTDSVKVFKTGVKVDYTTVFSKLFQEHFPAFSTWVANFRQLVLKFIWTIQVWGSEVMINLHIHD